MYIYKYVNFPFHYSKKKRKMVLFQFYCLPNDCRVFSSDALCKTMLRVKWIIPCKLFISWNLDIHVSMDSKLDLMLLHHSMKLIYCLSRTVMLSRFFILLFFFIIDLVMRMHYGFILCKCNRNSYCYSLSYCYGSFLYVFFFFFLIFICDTDDTEMKNVKI